MLSTPVKFLTFINPSMTVNKGVHVRVSHLQRDKATTMSMYSISCDFGKSSFPHFEGLLNLDMLHIRW